MRPTEARGEVVIDWICDYCSHEFKTTSKRRWDDVHGTAARNPTEYRGRVEKYAKRLYNRIFDFPAGSFKGDLEGFNKLAEKFSGRLGTRYGGRVGSEVNVKFLTRAANKLLARWDNPKIFKYYVENGLKSRGSPDPPGPDTHKGRKPSNRM